MNRRLIIRSLVLLLFLQTGCSNLSVGDQPLNEISIPIRDLEGIQVEISSGKLRLEGSDKSEMNILISSSSEIDPVIDQNTDTLYLDFGKDKDQYLAVISLPEDLNIHITSFNADIQVIGITASIDIHNTAGNISLVDFQGDAVLRAGRGDTNVESGSGDLVLIGEHGLLTIKDFQGPISATTIMGEIRFYSAENPKGDIHLETDHAPVTVRLLERSNYQVNVNSSGGIIHCAGNSISRTPTGCTGTTGEAEDLFEIRTVSGRVDFKILPYP